ncbi:unnamed protein product [Strongylus vulgaris]|uniref:Translation elongation factor EFTs/EF1B dimerisation domain-containing protein n=1 Tax=Strongylus vulgaris TaxID=40348 RepID=A0A3P7JR02_STRVU|nr:unnamed protein product [Strongylus vulgaris]
MKICPLMEMVCGVEQKQAATTRIDEDETALLRQAFMLNPSQTVYEYLKGHQAEVLDFVRSELGAAD